MILGVVVLAITGGEAKYADIGHFARQGRDGGRGRAEPRPEGFGPPPRDVLVVLPGPAVPALQLRRAGRLPAGAGRPAAGEHLLCPDARGRATRRSTTSSSASTWSISAIAAFIASQALITGMFSIVKQAIALGFCPRFDVKFTSREAEGQVYIPAINWAMFLGCVDDHARLPHGRQPGRGLRDRGHRDDGDHDARLRLRRALPLGLAALEGGGRLRADPGGRPAVLRQQPPEVPARRLLPRGDRRRARDDHADLAVGPGRAGQGVLRLRRRRAGRRSSWLVALRDKVDEIRISIEENLPQARALVQGRRRLVETDRAFVFLCSRPIREPRRVPPGLAAHLPQEVRRAAGPRHALPRQPDLGGRGRRGTRISR